MEKALGRLLESRRSLLSAIDGLSEAEMSHGAVEGAWTVKDLLGHITAWEAVFAEPLRQYASGGAFEAFVVPDHDVWNAERAAHRRDWPVQAVLDEMQVVRASMIDTARQLPVEKRERRFIQPWGGDETIAQALDGLAWHEEGHVKSIVQWRQRRA